jgi:hypothetical protein
MAILPRYHGVSISSDVLDLFTIINSDVHWIDDKPAHGVNARKRAPWGLKAGGKPVFERGRFVTASRCALLTNDIASAIQHGGDWPWQTGDDTRDMWQDEHARELQLLHARFALNSDGAVVWRVARGDDYKAGDLANGVPMSGLRCNLIVTSGVGYLVDDVKNTLQGA